MTSRWTIKPNSTEEDAYQSFQPYVNYPNKVKGLSTRRPFIGTYTISTCEIRLLRCKQNVGYHNQPQMNNVSYIFSLALQGLQEAINWDK